MARGLEGATVVWPVTSHFSLVLPRGRLAEFIGDFSFERKTEEKIIDIFK